MPDSKPPSPPPSATASQGFDDGFRQLVHHNAGTSYQPGSYQVESTPYVQSAPTTSYNSPEPRHMLLDHYNHRYFQAGPTYQDGLQYGLHEPGQGVMMYPNPPSGYQALTPAQTNYATTPYQFSSPPTPEISDHGERSRRTRNVRSAQPNGSPSLGDGSQASESPRPKRAIKKSKTDAVSEASIKAPLSQLCLDVPVVDVYSKVNRSIEERQEEARRDNKIKRPSNSFMLYRSAYGDRVKALYPQNNHQIISRICGASWKMETVDVTEQFKLYYEMEKENHAKAHPTYKFSPAKSSPSRKRRGTADTSDEEEIGSELGDFDAEYRPRGGRRSRPIKTPRTGTPTSYPNHSSVNNYQPYMVPNMAYANQSTWQYSNPGKPMPIPMNGSLDDRYWQTTIQQRGPNVEDVFVHRLVEAQSQVPTSSALIGLPGGSHEELLGVDSTANSPSPQVDPLLLTYDASLEGHAGDFVNNQEFQDFDHQGLYDGGLQGSGQAGVQHYPSALDSWKEEGNDGEFIGKNDFDWL
ncbi:MAG: hypothetical protein L6R38_001015 [Xanthoria sp. 2 TBL-2021]|nr:MAG: hypothetical protein L6R38_001015 [Xanthoria sp. 2 TBL-2021]